MTLYKLIYKNLGLKHLIWVGLPLALVLVLEIITTSCIPYTRKIVIDSLSSHSWAIFLGAAGISFLNLFLLTGSQGFKEWLGQRLSLSLREQMTTILKLPFKERKGQTVVANPYTRINDDTKLATEGLIKVIVECVISGSIVIGLLFTLIHQPMLLIVSILYSAVAMMASLFFRKPMITRNNNLKTAEADHRTSLTSIYHGNTDTDSDSFWVIVKETYTKYIRICRNYKIFNAFQSSLMYTIPFLIMAPDFFAGTVTIGDILQGTATFDLIVINATILVQLYPMVMDVQTSQLRVKELFTDLYKESA
jgi:ABC-type uncharacterized transport system fused permease/ATPase subunit